MHSTSALAASFFFAEFSPIAVGMAGAPSPGFARGRITRFAPGRNDASGIFSPRFGLEGTPESVRVFGFQARASRGPCKPNGIKADEISYHCSHHGHRP